MTEWFRSGPPWVAGRVYAHTQTHPRDEWICTAANRDAAWWVHRRSSCKWQRMSPRGGDHHPWGEFWWREMTDAEKLWLVQQRVREVTNG